MNKLSLKKCLKNIFISLIILIVGFGLSLLLQEYFKAQSLVSLILVLAVFLISLITDGYVYGIAASLLSVMINNYAFTFPYFKMDFTISENIVSGVVVLAVAIMTSMLTTKIKQQEKIKAESDKEKMRANLLRAISHDLRTPLTTIYGSCSVIMENYDSLKREQQLKLLGEIREDSENLIRMVENLLSVTKVNDENVRVGKTDTVLEELIDTVIMKFHKTYPEQEVDVNIPEEFVSIPMDALLIEQVLINLMENAVIHAKGMTTLELKVHLDDGYAVFEVIDNGCGISKDRLENLFTGYLGSMESPADGSRNNMGIGLSVCSAIIKAHGGELKAENRYGNDGSGAVFSFKLEVEELEDEQ